VVVAVHHDAVVLIVVSTPLEVAGVLCTSPAAAVVVVVAVAEVRSPTCAPVSACMKNKPNTLQVRFQACSVRIFNTHNTLRTKHPVVIATRLHCYQTPTLFSKVLALAHTMRGREDINTWQVLSHRRILLTCRSLCIPPHPSPTLWACVPSRREREREEKERERERERGYMKKRAYIHLCIHTCTRVHSKCGVAQGFDMNTDL
jgi:hypothetical protein